MNPTATPLQLGSVTATPNGQTTSAQMSSAMSAGWSPTQVNTTVNAGDLGATKPFNPPPANTSTTATNALGSAVAPAIPTDDPNRSDAVAKLLGLETGPSAYNKAGDTITQEDAQGVSTKLAAKNALDTQAMTTAKHYDDQINNLKNTFVGSPEGMNDKLNELTRNKNSELANIAIQQKVANEDYTGAMDIATKKVAADSEDAQNKITAMKDYISALDASPAEKAKMTLAVNAQQAQLDLQKEKALKDYQAQIDAKDPSKQADIAYKNAQTKALNILNGQSDGTGAYVVGKNPVVDSWVTNINSGKSKLSDVPKNLKNQVSQGLASTGSATADILNTTASSLKELNDMVTNDHGFTAAVGAKGLSGGLLFGWTPPGTEAADFQAKFKQTVNDVVLPNLSILHGLGRVTDREFQALQSSVTALNTSMSEGEFKSELKKITDTINTKMGTAGTTSTDTSTTGDITKGTSGTFNGSKYTYNGTGDTSDIKNWTKQ